MDFLKTEKAFQISGKCWSIEGMGEALRRFFPMIPMIRVSDIHKDKGYGKKPTLVEVTVQAHTIEIRQSQRYPGIGRQPKVN